MNSVDALVIGRKTFETVLAIEAWPNLRHVATRSYASGLVQSEYVVPPNQAQRLPNADDRPAARLK